MSKFAGIMQNKSERPRIRPTRTALDRVLTFIAINIGLTCLVYAAWWYPSLPTTIPTSLGPTGQVRDTGPSWTIFIMPLVALLLIGLMLLIQRWPWLSNTVVKITQENAEAQYRHVNRLLGLVAIEVGVIFLLVVWQIVTIAQGRPANALPLVVGFSTISWLPLLGWYFWASFRDA